MWADVSILKETEVSALDRKFLRVKWAFWAQNKL